MTSMTLSIKPDSPEHNTLMQMLQVRVQAAESAQTDRHQKWREAEERVLAYLPESAMDSRRRTRRDNGEPGYTTIQIPYSYAMLMSAHTYWTSVFFGRQPVHQFMGRHGETEQKTQALEALIDFQVTAGGMMGPYYIWLYDAGKYGVGILGTYWCKDTVRYSTIEGEDGTKIQTTFELAGYEGNKVYNVCPFDFLPDPRVSVGDFQNGEFVAIRRRLSWNEIKKRERLGYYTNVAAITTLVGSTDPGPDSWSYLKRPGDTNPSGVWTGLKHPGIVECYEMYLEIIPKEWKLGSGDYPEKWVFTFSKDFSVILGIQPLGCINNLFPFDVIETEIEAYGMWNRGIPEIMEPVQNTMDWLVNSHFYNVRAIQNNLFVVDPSRVVMKDFERHGPGGIIRLKPEAYGTDIRQYFHQVPMTDATQAHIADVGTMQNLGERILGVNDQIMGGISPGTRKTATEVRTSTGFGVNRLKTITEYISATAFSTHAQKLVQNSQQYYSAEKKFRIVGSLAQEAGTQFLQVTPDQIAGFYDYSPVDGTLPIDRFAQANLWKELIINMSRVPQVMMQYDLGRIFGWVASLAGLKNVNQFKVQVMPPGMMAPPGGNVVPLRPGGVGPAGAASAPDMTGLMPPAGAAQGVGGGGY